MVSVIPPESADRDLYKTSVPYPIIVQYDMYSGRRPSVLESNAVLLRLSSKVSLRSIESLPDHFLYRYSLPNHKKVSPTRLFQFLRLIASSTIREPIASRNQAASLDILLPVTALDANFNVRFFT